MPNSPIQFIVGLGNPGERYRQTPHNLGRELVLGLAEGRGDSWTDRNGYSRTLSLPACVTLHSYMNESGRAVAALLKDAGAAPEQILVCCDDFDIPMGQLRLRRKGSAGSHNGLKSIVETLAGESFPRLRLGIGPLPPGADPARFVLDPMEGESQGQAKDMLKRAAEALTCVLDQGFEAAMNKYNSAS